MSQGIGDSPAGPPELDGPIPGRERDRLPLSWVCRTGHLSMTKLDRLADVMCQLWRPEGYRPFSIASMWARATSTVAIVPTVQCLSVSSTAPSKLGVTLHRASSESARR